MKKIDIRGKATITSVTIKHPNSPNGLLTVSLIEAICWCVR